MKIFTRSKLDFKKVLVAKLNDAQMNSIIGGTSNQNLTNINDEHFKESEPGKFNVTNIDTSVMESYFCKY